MNLKIFSQKIGNNNGVFAETTAFCKKLIGTLVFEKKTPIFSPKLSKIAENCDHNIDPRSK
jgi:hypothetical protein